MKQQALTVGQGEEFTQGPADPEIFFDADGIQSGDAGNLQKCLQALLRGPLINAFISRSGLFRCDSAEYVCDPSGSTCRIGGKAGAVGRRKMAAESRNHIIVHEALADPSQGKDHPCARRIFR